MLKIDLPESQAKSMVAENVEKIEIGINNSNEYLLNGKIETLESIQQRLAQLDNKTRVLLRVDKRVTFEYFVTIIDLLKQHQLNHLSIITRHN
jgi:biopolymer transport protein ExbD